MISNSNWTPFRAADLLALNLLPPNWVRQINDVINDAGVRTTLKAEGTTVREAPDASPTHVMLVGGHSIKSKLPWLWQLYENELLSFTSKAWGRQYFVSNDAQNAINVNCLLGRGARYEKHVDSNPMTGLLFATDHSSGTGGALVFRHPESSEECWITPSAGTFICFDARNIVHWVEPLLVDNARVSIPMNYYFSSADQPRPDDLDEHIYGELENFNGADKA